MLCFQLFRSISDVLDNRIPQPLLTTSTLFIFTFCIFKEVGLIREKHVAPWRRRWCSTGTKWLSTRRDVATSRRWIISLWASNRQIREIGHRLTWLCPHLLRAIPRRIWAERGCKLSKKPRWGGKKGLRDSVVQYIWYASKKLKTQHNGKVECKIKKV